MRVVKNSTGIMRIVLAILVQVLLSTHAFHAAEPRITAGEVEDRATLKAFVKAAAKIYREALLSEDDSRVADVRNALRVEGGDWRDGSVYVYVINEEGYTFFHGADVRREGRKINLDRADLNGVKFIREIVAAGTAGGGYVEYHWDNPAVEGDEVNGSPKIGYAEGFRLPGKDQIFIVGSGIYTTDR